MSRLAKKSIHIPEGVVVTQDSGAVSIRGPKGALSLKVLPYLSLGLKSQELNVKVDKSTKQSQANLGTMWSLIRNAILGVTEGFSKTLEIEGVGFRASLEGKILILNLGFVNSIRFSAPEGVTISVEKNTITVSGINKELVGQVAAEIRSLRKPEPYKGKGIHYLGEVIRRKTGKKAVATS